MDVDPLRIQAWREENELAGMQPFPGQHCRACRAASVLLPVGRAARSGLPRLTPVGIGVHKGNVLETPSDRGGVDGQPQVFTAEGSFDRLTGQSEEPALA